MNKIIKFGAVAALIALPAMAFASANLTHLTLDGATNATVEEGGSVDGKVTFNITSSTDVESLSWELIGSGLPQTCVDTNDRIANGTFTSTFDIETEGASEGTWDVMIRLYGDDDANVSNLCETTDQVDSEQFNDRITVTDNTDDNQANNNNVGGDSKPSWLDALIASIVAAVKPTTPTPPATSAKCSALATKLLGTQMNANNSANVMLQGYLLSEGMSIPALAAGASFGFYGPQTSSAVQNFKAMNQCS